MRSIGELDGDLLCEILPQVSAYQLTSKRGYETRPSLCFLQVSEEHCQTHELVRQKYIARRILGELCRVSVE